MGIISVTLPSDGTTADVADFGTPVTTIVNAINGNLDSTNISSLNGTKITAATIPGTAFDTNTAGGWIAGLATPNTITANGNRSYSLVFNGTDLTGKLSPGMRLRTTRTVAAPTQCTSLNGTTQYYTKSSPAGMTFTDTPTLMAWVKLTAYGTTNVIVSRKATGTAAGWELLINSSGQVQIRAGNTAGNLDDVTSYQSIPLNKWVHVAAVLTMSTGASSFIYIDGVSAPGAFTNGTSTTITNSGTLSIGANNDASNFFTGKIAQVAIFSAAIAQATIQGYISQGLAGTETSLVSAYSFNNSINDLNANANNLTANGSAAATNADSPFGGQAGGAISSTLDYGIVQSVAFSTNTTVVVQVPEGCTIPTSGGVSAVSYSSNKAPYGMPLDSDKWRIVTLKKTDDATTSNVTYGSYISGGFSITLPIGSWGKFGWGGGSIYSTATAGDVTFALAPSSIVGLTRAQGANISRRTIRVLTPAAAALVTSGRVEQPEVVSSATVYTIYSIGASTAAGIDGLNAYAEIYAENAYL